MHDLISQLRGRGGERGRRNWGGMERRWKTRMDGEEDSSRDGWMDDGGKVDFGITLAVWA